MQPSHIKSDESLLMGDLIFFFYEQLILSFFFSVNLVENVHVYTFMHGGMSIFNARN